MNIKLFLMLLVLIIISAHVDAAVQIGTPSPSSVIIKNPTVTTTGGGSNSSSNFTQADADALYWRLDASNDPPTSNWNMGNFGFMSLGTSNITGDLNLLSGGLMKFYNGPGTLLGQLSSTGGSTRFIGLNGGSFGIDADNGTVIYINDLRTTTDFAVDWLNGNAMTIDGSTGLTTFAKNITAPNICYSNGTGCSATGSNLFTVQNGYITNSTTSGLNVSGNIIAQTQLQSQSAYLKSSAPELQMVVDASGALVRSIFKTQFLNSNRLSNVSMFGYAGAFNSSGDYNSDFVYINPDVLQNNFLGHNTGSPFKFHKGGNFSINEDLSTSVARISVVGSLATASGSEPMLWFEKPISGGVSWAQVGQVELGRATGQTGSNPNSALFFKLKNAATNANPNVVDTTIMELATSQTRIISPLNVTNQTIVGGTIATLNASSWANFAVCYRAGGVLGHCTNAVNSTGGCTCASN